MVPQLNEILKLSLEERVILAEKLWSSIAGDTRTPERMVLTQYQKKILENELSSLKNEPDAGSPWKEVKRRIRKKK